MMAKVYTKIIILLYQAPFDPSMAIIKLWNERDDSMDGQYVPVTAIDEDGTKLTYLNLFQYEGESLILDPGGAEDVKPIRSRPGYEDRNSWEDRWNLGVTA
jgi:hypothetical protein